MAAYAVGDARAFEELVSRYRARVFGFLRRLVNNDELAEDALMETLLKVHRSAHNYQPRGTFKAWLFHIAYREGVDVLHHHRKHQGSAAATELERAASRAASPEALAIDTQRLARVDHVLRLLPETQRAAFLLYYGEGLETPAIARALDITGSSVRSYLTLARQALRVSAEPLGEEA